MNQLMGYLLWGWKIHAWTPRGTRIKLWLLPPYENWHNYITLYI